MKANSKTKGRDKRIVSRRILKIPAKGATNKKAAPKLIPVTFTLEAPREARVFVAGSFNNWAKDTHPLHPVPNQPLHRATAYMERGSIEYKFIIDGIWTLDPGNAMRIPNPFGSLNNILQVQS